MKLKEYLAGFKGLDPEMEVIYSSDDEGNNFQSVGNTPTVFWAHTSNNYHFDVIADEDYESGEYEKDDYKQVICIN